MNKSTYGWRVSGRDDKWLTDDWYLSKTEGVGYGVDFEYSFVMEREDVVCIAIASGRAPYAEEKLNSRKALISAAPDMLDVLEDIAARLDASDALKMPFGKVSITLTSADISELRAAIGRATNRPTPVVSGK